MPLDRLILLVVFIVLCIVIVVSTIRVGGTPWRFGRFLERFARDNPGFHVDDGGDFKQLVGSVGGVRVEATITTRTTRGSRWVTYATATCPGYLPRDFVLRPRALPRDASLFERVAGYLHLVPAVTHPIYVGDGAFDNAFLVTGADPEEVRRFLGDPRLREALLTIHAREHRLAIAGGRVYVERKGVTEDVADLRVMLENAAEAAQALAWADHHARTAR
jgi:hypothetical protein